MEITKSKFTFGQESLAVTEFIDPLLQRHKNVLIMHGGGEAGQARCTTLAEALAREGYRVLTFDFSSHGESTGQLEDLSLEKRQLQAQAIISHYDLLERPLTLIGFSMSGQTAIDVASTVKEVNCLVLFVPAVYDRRARNARFGSESKFTQLIRQPDSWELSDAWQKIAKFRGKCLIFEAENDKVIPKDVPSRLFESLKTHQNCVHMLVKHSPHAIGTWMTEKAERAACFAKIISDFEKTGSTNVALFMPTIKIEILSQK